MRFQKANNLRDGYGNPISSFSGALDIHDADSHTKVINYYLHRHNGVTTTLAVDSVVGDYQITVASATGFTIGDYIHINTSSVETTHPKITNIVGNVFTLDRRLDKVHNIGDSIEKSIIDMSTTAATMANPVIYWAGPETGTVWHITRIIFEMTHGTAGDFGLFGNLASLANGAVLRSRINSEYYTFTNWKTNANIKTDMYDVVFDARSSGGGSYGTSGRGTFTNAGAIVRLDGSNNDRLELVIQDNITSLTTFTMKAQWHIEGA